MRRGDTFPGLGPEWLRVAVRDKACSDQLAGALTEVLGRPLRISGAAATGGRRAGPCGYRAKNSRSTGASTSGATWWSWPSSVSYRPFGIACATA